MRQQKTIRRRPARPAAEPVDLRTPIGRLLPF